ncbi:unnamed protein product [Symbiodinium natans]|uniref:Heterokaryon incompatibility domain-containing protein n=1 Tax=Symbiodinium natans TaxID=878477 RepID=A0A812LRD5_9DINO|nr:unnamed protein product [Symbiodinium natans]
MVMIVIMVGASALGSKLFAVGLYNFHRSQVAYREELRASVRSLAELYAEEISRQIRASTRSLEALQAAVKIDSAGMTEKHFDDLAQSLIGSIMGISALGLAPGACLTKMYPPDKFVPDGSGDLLLHPDRGPQATEAILARTTYIDDAYQSAEWPDHPSHPSDLHGSSGHQPDFVARRPIFTSYAPVYMPDSWMVYQGRNYTRRCSGTDYPAEIPNCYFPGPPDVHGDATYFWGFAVMSVSFEDLLRTISLEDLERGVHRVAGFTRFAYQLSSEATTADREALRKWPHSNSSLGADPESFSIVVPELSLRWKLALSPLDGWKVADPNLTYVLLLLPLSALIGVCLGMDVILALRKHSQMEIWKLYMHEVRARTIQSAISNLNVIQFPFCVVCLEDFEKFGMILRHENIRDRGLLHSVDTAQEAAEFCRLDGVAFISHQWAGFSHPDPHGEKYAAVVRATRELQRRGIRANWIWMDYCCLPQENKVQQQSAINSMFAYTSFCTSFIALAPTCKHVDSGEEITVHTKQERLWCRLEQLCFAVSRAGYSDETFAYTAEEGLIQDDPVEEDILSVMNGTSTCCQLCHAGSSPCDKQRVVSVMLGVYWRLLVLNQKNAGVAGWARHLLDIVEADEGRFFPDKISLLDEGGGTYEVDLFEGYLPVLREMFAEDQGRFLKHSVSDPCAFAGTTSSTMSRNVRVGRSNSTMSRISQNTS